MSNKTYTPKEAAMAVLKKAQEIALNKGEWGKIHGKLEREGYSKKQADKIDGAIKAKVESKEIKKDEDMGGEDSGDMMMSEKPMKGHIKLAKFMGRMEHKKQQNMAKTEVLGEMKNIKPKLPE
jgi:hypothetical protein